MISVGRNGHKPVDNRGACESDESMQLGLPIIGQSTDHAVQRPNRTGTPKSKDAPHNIEPHPRIKNGTERFRPMPH